MTVHDIHTKIIAQRSATAFPLLKSLLRVTVLAKEIIKSSEKNSQEEEEEGEEEKPAIQLKK